MQYIITLPEFGYATNDVIIRRLLRQPGDRIRQGELLLAASIDKERLNVESFADGYLREWLVKEGCATHTLTAVAVLTDTPNESYKCLSNGDECVSLASVPVAVAARRASSYNLAAESPLRKRARYKNKLRNHPGKPVDPVSKQNVPESLRELGRRSLPVNGFSSRTVMAATTTGSKREIPHFYVTVDVSMKYAAEWRTDWNTSHPKLHVTYNDLFVMCASRSLEQTPLLRMAYHGGKYEQRAPADILLAVAQEPAFALIPLSDPSKLTWAAFLKAIRRATKMSILQDANPLLAISNLGMFGVKEFAAIVPPSCTAIVAVGAVRETVTMRDGAASPELVCALTLSADHRVVDGVTAARFLQRFQSHLNSL